MAAPLTAYQIFYSPQTRAMLDPGFTPLDNSVNERPDWREYWPIRRVLLGTPLDEDRFYAFLAPRFGEKARLSALQVQALVARAAPETDVVILSPYPDQAAIYLNVFEQGDAHQKGLMSTAERALAAAGQALSPRRLVNSTRDAIFCNYFAARPAFWRAWLDLNERLFALAEARPSALADEMSKPVGYNNTTVDLKVFIMERIASYLLGGDPRWRAMVDNPFALPHANPAAARQPLELFKLDALKLAFKQTGDERYLAAFLHARMALGFAPPA